MCRVAVSGHFPTRMSGYSYQIQKGYVCALIKKPIKALGIVFLSPFSNFREVCLKYNAGEIKLIRQLKNNKSGILYFRLTNCITGYSEETSEAMVLV
jgi:hypothetical protein